MPRPTPAQLQSARDRVVPDLLGPGVRLLFAGINPSLWTAATGAHFARPGNRFWPALHRGGLTAYPIDCSAGMTEADAAYLIRRGIGITNLVPRATARADELTAAELRAGGVRLGDLVAEHRPAVLAICGITAYRTAFGRPRAAAGRQPEDAGDAELWVVPNPSGLNAHESIDSLARAYAEVARRAGIQLESRDD